MPNLTSLQTALAFSAEKVTYLNALQDVTAALENTLLHCGDALTTADKSAREKTVAKAAAILSREGWG